MSKRLQDYYHSKTDSMEEINDIIEERQQDKINRYKNILYLPNQYFYLLRNTEKIIESLPKDFPIKF